MSTPTPSKDPKSFKDRIKELGDKENMDNFLEYARTHTREMSAYALLVLGIICLFINSVLGQALVGVVLAVYFGNEILDIVFHYDAFISRLGLAKSIVFLGGLLAFFILAPIIFIAAGFTLGLKHLFEGSSVGK